MKHKIAVIGSGAAGLTAAYILQQKHDVRLFEKSQRFGGHAHTVYVSNAEDQNIALDVGFMVMNTVNYPHLYKLLKHLGITHFGTSEMSFGYSNSEKKIEYALNWQLNNEYAQRLKAGEQLFTENNYLQQMLPDIIKFMTKANKFLAEEQEHNLSLAEFFKQHLINKTVIDNYIIPMGAAIWSTPNQYMLDFPAKSFLGFFANHGLLSLGSGFSWQHIIGGSQQYVDKIIHNLGKQAVASADIHNIERSLDKIKINFVNGESSYFDKLVLACHADEALALLANPTEEETKLLTSWQYAKNPAVLHTDARLMPSNPAAWASWNFISTQNDNSSLCCTYHLNRLQGHHNAKLNYFLTLNPYIEPLPEKTIQTIIFTHPMYSTQSFIAQQEIRNLNGSNHTYFCGSYLGFGFHEDAVQSAVQVAKLLGCHL